MKRSDKFVKRVRKELESMKPISQVKSVEKLLVLISELGGSDFILDAAQDINDEGDYDDGDPAHYPDANGKFGLAHDF